MEKKTWNEFRESGLLWWINMVLHTFGWAIVLELNDNGEIITAYPARVDYRGFTDEINTIGYTKVSKYLFENIEDIKKESEM